VWYPGEALPPAPDSRVHWLSRGWPAGEVLLPWISRREKEAAVGVVWCEVWCGDRQDVARVCLEAAVAERI
jgi:hypothetical protein